ncbi:MAG TPA: arginine--tRNA ligase [Candidatus Azoamicus sp. OHIO2]
MINQLKKFCFDAIIAKKSLLHKQFNIELINIVRTKNNNFGHFQLLDSVSLAKIIGYNVSDMYSSIIEYLANSSYQKKLKITFIAPCFINFTLNIDFIEEEVKNLLYYKNKSDNIEKIILDYSSPNIAKEMHVGHLRSTIIGECLSNLFKLCGHKVIKLNHLGDWGTQFGMLIAYIKIKYDGNDMKKLKMTLSDLARYYRKAQIKFINDHTFVKKAKDEVIKLQKEDTLSIGLWKKITMISKREYERIYKLLHVNIQYKGESFYNKMLQPFVTLLTKKKLTVVSESALCIYLDGFKNKVNTPLPLIIQKSDGGFNYATTDLAALYYRVTYHKPSKIIYVTDIGQKNHFDMIFQAINKIKIKNNNTKLIHVAFGFMLSTGGKKIKTRSGKSEKLIKLIMTAIDFAKCTIKNKGKYMSNKELSITAVNLGINTIRYADLSNKIDQNYIFDYKKMLKFKGNTASFLIYAYVRIIGIFNKFNQNNRKINKSIDGLILIDNIEIDLSLHLLQYPYIIKKTVLDLNPNILTSYLYGLAEKFHLFFQVCPILTSNLIMSRLLLCKVTKNILEVGFNILGFQTINKM